MKYQSLFSGKNKNISKYRLLKIISSMLREKQYLLRGMFEMNCLLSSGSISTWGTIKTNTYLYRVIQYLHNGV